MSAAPPRPTLAVLVGASDPGSTRLVYAMIFGLIVIGLLFIALAVWLIRRTRVDPEVLAPLERMGDSAWLKRDSSTQRRLLDEVRPPGATPLRAEPAAPTIDEEFDTQSQRPAASLSDLGPGVLPERDPTPTGASDPLDVPESEPEAVDVEVVDADVDDSEVDDSEIADPSPDGVESAADDATPPEPKRVDEPAPETAG